MGKRVEYSVSTRPCAAGGSAEGSLISRRELILGSSAAALTLSQAPTHAAPASQKAQIAITFDLEMARHYPTWDQTNWDYEKGNLDSPTKEYALEAARRVRERGGVMHFFVVGRVLEQENVEWLEEIVRLGHSVGNHTYDHVNLRARKTSEIQYRFRRCPWLIEGQEVRDVIARNIQMTTSAMKSRLGISPAGFRAPGGFPEGLGDHPEVQQLLMTSGFDWVSTRYVSHQTGAAGYVPQYTEERSTEPPREVFDSILAAQESSQPFAYPSGLIEIPMSPVSDLIAFRTGRWKLTHFLKSVHEVVEQTIQRRMVWDFLGHPSCLSVTDPEFKTVELICDLVRRAPGQAEIVDLESIARGVTRSRA